MGWRSALYEAKHAVVIGRRSLIGAGVSLIPGVAAADCGEEERRKLLRFGFIEPAYACGNSPGAPTITTGAVTATSVTVSIALPTTGGPQDHGQLQVQYKLVSASTYTNGPTIPYVTPGSGTFTDAFNNVWAIATSVGGVTDGITINNLYNSPTNNATFMLMIGNVVDQLGLPTGSWYNYTTTGAINSGNIANVVYGGPTTTSPLTSIVINGLTASQTYDFRVNMSNSQGTGPFSNVATGTTTSGTTSKVIWGSATTPHGAASVTTQNAALASTGQTITTLEAYYEQSWGGFYDTDIFSGAANQIITPANGGFPIVAFSPGLSGSVAQTCTDIASGSQDGNINAVFQNFASHGYTKMGIRILWEINIDGSPQPSNYVAAWTHFANLCFAAKTSFGIQVYTIFNPGAGSAATSWYPGNSVVDWIGIDESANWDGQGLYSNPLNLSTSNYSIGGAAAFAAQNGKPLAVCEGGVANSAQTTTTGSNGENFLTTLSSSINASQTSITVASASGYPSTPFPIQIDSEWLNVTSVSGTTLTIGPYSGLSGTGRGFNGTTAASHSSGAQVTYGGYCAWCCNIMTAMNLTGAKMVEFGFYNTTDDGTDENWSDVAADTQAVINFVNLCPAWTGSLSTTGH